MREWPPLLGVQFNPCASLRVTWTMVNCFAVFHLKCHSLRVVSGDHCFACDGCCLAGCFNENGGQYK